MAGVDVVPIFFALIDLLVKAGYKAVAFDAPAHGESSGRRTNMLEVTQTLAAVAESIAPINLKKSVDRSILLLICCSNRKSVR
jgi:alpha-beta hydrolase superfamily lysophospholipase